MMMMMMMMMMMVDDDNADNDGDVMLIVYGGIVLPTGAEGPGGSRWKYLHSSLIVSGCEFKWH